MRAQRARRAREDDSGAVGRHDHVQTFLSTDHDHTFLLGRQNMYVKNGTNFRNTAVGFFCLLCAQYINVFASIITHHLRVTIASYFCQRLQQLLSLNVFQHYASRCSRRYMQPGPTHARRKPMQPSGFFYVSCVLNILMFLQTSSLFF